MTRAISLSWAFGAALGVVAIPSAAFAVTALATGLSPAETAAALTEQFSARNPSLLLTGVVGLFPVLLLGLLLWLHARLGGAARQRAVLALAGYAPIAGVLIWANAEYWPDYLPERVQPSFPHGLELVIGPAIIAPAGMLLGLLAAAIALRIAR